MKRRKSLGVMFASLLAVGALSACAGNASADGVVTGADEIVVGTIGSFSGPAASVYGPAQGVIEAWAEDINAAGGINGRQVRLEVKDDGANATTSLTAARELMREGVVAIVGHNSLPADVWAEVVTEAGVPVVGGSPSTTAMMTNPNFFPIGTNLYAQSYGKVATAATLGDEMGSLYCAEAPVCAAAANGYPEYAKLIGIEVPVVLQVLGSAPNFTAQCQAILDAGVQSYVIDQPTEVAIRIADACADQGVTASVIGSAGTVSSTWLDHAAAQNAHSVDTGFPFFADSTPATQEYQEFLKRHDLGDGGGGAGAHAYAGGKLFEAALAKIGDADVTQESVLEGLYALKDETLGGLSPAPLTFIEGERTHVNCWFTSAIENGQFTLPDGMTTACAPDDFVVDRIAELE